MPGTLSTFVGTRNSIKSMYLPTSPFFWKGTCSQTLLTWLFLGGQPTVLQLRKTHLRKTVFPTRPSQGVQRLGTTWTKNETQERPTKKVRKDRPLDRRPSTGGSLGHGDGCFKQCFWSGSRIFVACKKMLGARSFELIFVSENKR